MKWICKACGHAWKTETDDRPESCPNCDAPSVPSITSLDNAAAGDLLAVLKKRVSDDLG